MTLPLDRAAHRRTDAAFLSAIREVPGTRLVPVWRSRNLVTAATPRRAVWPTLAEAPGLLAAAEETTFLGVDAEGTAFLLVDLPREDEPEGLGGLFQDLRVVGMELPRSEFELLAYARGMAHWHRSARFDPRSGEGTVPLEGGFARAPGGDPERKVFPRTDPAVMMLLTDGADRCLLARQHRWPAGMYSALAGFVEPGESLEECVARESFEEVGLLVRDLRYTRSQAWPFPASLMIGFEAVVEPGELRVDPTELEDARWIHREALRAPTDFFVPPPISLAWRMIQDFVER